MYSYVVSGNYFYLIMQLYGFKLFIIIFSKQLKLQVTILKTNNFQLYGIKYSYQKQIIFKQIYLTLDETLTDTTTPGQSRPGSNGNKRDTQHSPERLTIRCS